MNHINPNEQRQESEGSPASASQGNGNLIRILHLEDDPVTTKMVREQLRRDNLEVEIDRVDTLADFTQRLSTRQHALILSDFTIPGMDTFEALRLAHSTRPDLP
ncbi:MAG TPA: response regulator, partial [Clostridia bacterium]|nr:response regulator [Clostridia bacterium]